MPIKFVKHNELAPSKRKSKLYRLDDWTHTVIALQEGIPAGKVLVIEFAPETLRAFKNDPVIAARSFVSRLRKEFGNRYRIRLINGEEIRIEKLAEAKK